MFLSVNNVLLCLSFIIFNPSLCASDIIPPPLPPSLNLHIPGEPEYTDVLVKRVHDNLTLACELRGDAAPRVYVWNHVPANESHAAGPLTTEPAGPTTISYLHKWDLQLTDSGHYMCSAPPFSVTKYILVQSKGPTQCARGAFWCGARCVFAGYVCDGRDDCARGEDEAQALCGARVCDRADKLNCSMGRCISEAACCRGAGPLCRQPDCCEEHPRYSAHRAGFVEVEYPTMFDDRHAPDDYGFIQSTIYTVTACALIFMIAVVLLVSAICKMHMKRAALRSYAHANRHRQCPQYAGVAAAHRFPPCYEASRLLEQDPRPPSLLPTPERTPAASPTRQPQCPPECPPLDECSQLDAHSPPEAGCLSRLATALTSRYRQVPTQCCDVEMTDVRPSSASVSPTRDRSRLDNYRSPTFCDLNSTEFYFTNPEAGDCGRDLNYMATPVEFFRRRTLGLEDRPLTLQLGRFQLSIPRFGRRNSTERRPDTPNVAEINIHDLDFVRLNSNETYTLNGRTIRLLGANIENYPVGQTTTRPPPYNEAMRYKVCGPPPEYLSTDILNSPQNAAPTNVQVDEEARSNVEMPPRYEDLTAGHDRANNNGEDTVSVDNANVNGDIANDNTAASVSRASIDVESACGVSNAVSNGNDVAAAALPHASVEELSINAIIDNLPAIDSDVNAN